MSMQVGFGIDHLYYSLLLPDVTQQQWKGGQVNPANTLLPCPNFSAAGMTCPYEEKRGLWVGTGLPRAGSVSFPETDSREVDLSLFRNAMPQPFCN